MDVVVCPGEVLSVLDVDVLEGLDVLVEAASLQLNSLHVCISDYKKNKHDWNELCAAKQAKSVKYHRQH